MKNIFYTALVIIIFTVGNSSADELNYSLNSSVIHSDNLAERPDEISGNSASVGFNFDYENNEISDWEFNALGSFRFTDYSVDSLENEKEKSLTARAFYEPSDNNFSVLLLDNFFQLPRNRFLTQDINNLREINVVLLKPSYYINVSSLDKIKFEVNYTNFENFNSEDDISILYGSRETQETSFGYEHKFSSISSLGVYRNTVDTDFQEIINNTVIDFEQTDKFIRWQTLAPSTQFEIEFGESEVTDNLLQKSSADLKRVRINRQINRNHILTLRYIQGFDTVSNSDLATNSININTSSSDFGTAQKVKVTSILYTAGDALLNTRISIADRKNRSAIGDESEDRKEFILESEYSLSQLFQTPIETTVVLSYRLFKNDFDTVISNVTQSRTEIFEIRFNYSYSRELSFFSGYINRIAEDDNPTFDNDTNSHSIDFGFIYRPR